MVQGEQFDLIYSFGVIHHTPNPDVVFQQIGALLKPHGQVDAYVCAPDRSVSMHGLLQVLVQAVLAPPQLRQDSGTTSLIALVSERLGPVWKRNRRTRPKFLGSPGRLPGYFYLLDGSFAQDDGTCWIDCASSLERPHLSLRHRDVPPAPVQLGRPVHLFGSMLF